MTNSEYWEKRIASQTWKIYNSLEEKNRDLLDFYMKASEKIRTELYIIAEQMERDGILSRTEMYEQQRLQKLEKKYRDIAYDLGKQIEKKATDNMLYGFQEVYKNIAVAMGDIDYTMPNKKLMEKLLKEKWRGDNFSGRLWKNQKQLAMSLNDVLLTGLQQGKTVTAIAVSLHDKVGNGFSACHRLVRTETMHYLNSATLQRYKDAGVKYVQILAAQDERTCETCGSYHGKIYPIDKCPVLPFHANCRCTIIPVTDEEVIKRYEKEYGAAAKEAIRNTNTPVKFNEKYNYTVSFDWADEKTNTSISKCARKVAELGSEDGNEHMFLVNTKTGEPLYYEKGISGEVGGEKFWNFLDENKEEQFVFIHNHNTDGYFSETDMRTLLRTNQINGMIAVRNDAVIYVAEKGSEIPDTGFFDDLFEKELEVLNEEVKEGKLSLSERNIRREEIIVDGLIERYTKKRRLVEVDGRK